MPQSSTLIDPPPPPAWFSLAALLGLVLLAGGCGSDAPAEMARVRGTVKYADQSVPQGDVSMVQFVPVQGGTHEVRKPAYGEIRPDGTFELTTSKPGDGAFLGDYKVYFTIFKTTESERQALVPEAYTRPETTPETRSVASGTNTFDFEIPQP